MYKSETFRNVMMKLEFALHKQNLDLHLAGDYLNFDDELAKAFLLEKTREKSTHAVSVDVQRWAKSRFLLQLMR